MSRVQGATPPEPDPDCPDTDAWWDSRKETPGIYTFEAALRELSENGGGEVFAAVISNYREYNRKGRQLRSPGLMEEFKKKIEEYTAPQTGRQVQIKYTDYYTPHKPASNIFLLRRLAKPTYQEFDYFKGGDRIWGLPQLENAVTPIPLASWGKTNLYDTPWYGAAPAT